MDSPQNQGGAIEAAGLTAEWERDLHVASLRYFTAAGPFAAQVRESIGAPLPEPLRANTITGASGHAHFILAWRSPSETMILSDNRAAFTDLETRLAAAAADGCMVDQTGGIWGLQVRGGRARALLQRLAATTAIPAVGEARSGRLAELHVLTVCVQAEEYILLVERVYADHLFQWVGRTLQDLQGWDAMVRS